MVRVCVVSESGGVSFMVIGGNDVDVVVLVPVPGRFVSLSVNSNCARVSDEPPETNTTEYHSLFTLHEPLVFLTSDLPQALL